MSRIRPGVGPAATAGEGDHRDELFRVLSHPRRRFVLRHLERTPTSVPVSQVAMDLHRWERRQGTPEDPGGSLVGTVESLRDNHLPRMAAGGFLEYDTDRQTVASGVRTAEAIAHLALDEPGATDPSSDLGTVTTDRTPASSGDVLIVEDSPAYRRLLLEAFAEAGSLAKLQLVADGAAALKQLRRHRDTDPTTLPDLVITDLHLPGRHGHEVLGEIRDDPQLTYLPVIVLTDATAESDIARCFEAGATAYVNKPTEFEDLVSLVSLVDEFWLTLATRPPIQS